MPKKTKKDEEKDNTVAGYSGSPHEGKGPPKRPKGASEDAVLSDCGATEPTVELKGDGLTTKQE